MPKKLQQQHFRPQSQPESSLPPAQRVLDQTVQRQRAELIDVDSSSDLDIDEMQRELIGTASQSVLYADHTSQNVIVTTRYAEPYIDKPTKNTPEAAYADAVRRKTDDTGTSLTKAPVPVTASFNTTTNN